MRIERWIAVACTVAALAVSGCTEPPKQQQRSNFLKTNPWVVQKPGQQGSGGGNAVVSRPNTGPAASGTPSAAPVQYKADTEIVSPIFEAKGNWTVRLAFYNPSSDGSSALRNANAAARVLRGKGYDAYVTDLVSKAIVSIGSFEDERDPKLIDLWRDSYEDWTKIYGGRKSPFRESMEQFYGNQTVFGDQPWPVSIIDLQVKMKAAYKIPLTEDDKRRYKDYLAKRGKTGETS